MSVEVFGHTFTDFKSSERICWTCGYVIDRDSNASEVEERIIEDEGCELHCGGRWGKYECRISAQPASDAPPTS